MNRRALGSRLAILPLVVPALAGCSPLLLLDGFEPDHGLHREDGVAFGPLPRHRLDVHLPADLAAPAPVVVFVYGGSWSSGERGLYRFVGRALAARGFVTVIPDYRLVPDVRFAAFLEDGALAVRWVVDNCAGLGGDPGRIVLMGHSAGAYNVAMLGLDARFLAAVGLERSVLAGVVGLAGPYDFLPFDVEATIAAFGAWPEPLATQPPTFVDAAAPPFLLLHGAADTTVLPRNSRVLHAALREAGADATLLLYPELGHAGILLALTAQFRDRAPVLDDVVAWIGRRDRTAAARGRGYPTVTDLAGWRGRSTAVPRDTAAG